MWEKDVEQQEYWCCIMLLKKSLPLNSYRYLRSYRLSIRNLKLLISIDFFDFF